MIKLKPFETCKHQFKCKFKPCEGTNSKRDTEFICELSDPYGNIDEGYFNNPMDKTGKSKIILE